MLKKILFQKPLLNKKRIIIVEYAFFAKKVTFFRRTSIWGMKFSFKGNRLGMIARRLSIL